MTTITFGLTIYYYLGKLCYILTKLDRIYSLTHKMNNDRDKFSLLIYFSYHFINILWYIYGKLYL